MLTLLLACTAPDDEATDTGTPPGDTSAPADTSSPEDSGDSGDTGPDAGPDTGDTGGVVEAFDCSILPEPKEETVLEGVNASKGIAWDDEGHLVGSDGTSLVKSTYSGDQELWIPGAGDVEGLGYLSGGDLISTYGYGRGEIIRYTPEGGQTVLVGGLDNYSVAIAPNDMIFAAGWDGGFIVDPDTGDYTQILSDGQPMFPQGVSPRSLTFSADFRTLYIGTIDNQGRIYTLALDEDYQPAGDVELFATGLGHGWHDGLGLDACGNVYAVDYDSSSLYRASRDGKEVVKLVDWSANSRQFGHGLAFGTGSDGWRIDAIYLPMPESNKTVKEIVLGVPGRDWEGQVTY